MTHASTASCVRASVCPPDFERVLLTCRSLFGFLDRVLAFWQHMVCRSVTESVARVHGSCHRDLTARLRFPLTAPEKDDSRSAQLFGFFFDLPNFLSLQPPPAA